GSGDRTLRLDVTDDDTIIDTAGNMLGGAETGNRNFNSFPTRRSSDLNPTTSITSSPSNPSNNTSPSFSFTGSDPTAGGVSSGVNHLETQIDGGGFSTHTSPQALSGLSAGSHTFHVRAVDNAGNTGSAT